jgi:hypothetical protein
MKNLETLLENAKPTINMVGLSILTVGIYPIMWLYENIESFGSFSRKPYTKWSVIIIAALFAWQTYLSNIINTLDLDPYSNVGLIAFVAILSMILSIAFLIFHFVVITAPSIKGLSDHLLITEKIDLKINAFFAFIFAYLYMNYKINEVIELRKRKAMMG